MALRWNTLEIIIEIKNARPANKKKRDFAAQTITDRREDIENIDHKPQKTYKFVYINPHINIEPFLTESIPLLY